MAENKNYVKFLKGTLAQYQQIATKDSNTLYFVQDNNKVALYLGDALIAANLEDANNVVLNNDTLANNQVLFYQDGKWINGTVSELAGTDLGALTSRVGVVEGTINTLVKTTVPEINASIDKLSQTLDNDYLKGSDVESLVNAKIADAAHLKREVITLEPDETFTEALKKVESNPEAVNTIYLIKEPNSTSDNDIYGEYFIVKEEVEGQEQIKYHYERLGSWTVDLENYVSKGDYDSDMNDIDAQLTAITESIESKDKENDAQLADFDESLGAIDKRLGIVEDAAKTYALKTDLNNYCTTSDAETLSNTLSAEIEKKADASEITRVEGIISNNTETLTESIASVNDDLTTAIDTYDQQFEAVNGALESYKSEVSNTYVNVNRFEEAISWGTFPVNN